MISQFQKRVFTAFTLIELLIVVLIIAILAAIAVPNFLEFQTRAKVSRTSSDMRSLRTAIEAYYVDNEQYPDTDLGQPDYTQPGVGLIRVTTPIQYFSTLPRSPWSEKFGTGGTLQNAHFERENGYLYVRAKIGNLPGVNESGAVPGRDENFVNDRVAYLSYGELVLIQLERAKGEYMLKSVGPNNEDDRDTLGTNARVYDPTNGTVSEGDVIVFNDRQGLVGQ